MKYHVSTYLINTPANGSEGVSAHGWEILPSGALAFYDKDPRLDDSRLVIAYAHGTWTSFFPEESA